MNVWLPEHAQQVIAARDVLDRSPGEPAPADYLYQHWYAAHAPLAATAARWEPPVASAARAAHRGATDWSADDSVVVATGIAGVVVVSSPRGRRALCRGEYVTTQGRPGFPPRVGDRVRSLRRLGAVVQEGWWRTWGDGWDVKHPDGPIDRVYMRPVGGAVAGLVECVTSTVAQADSWLLKVAPTIEGLSRPDAVVLYLGGPEREQVRESVVAAVVGLTVGEPPPLTRRVGDGIGWAQDPGTGESFGEVRCRAIATAYTARAGETMDDQAWLEQVADEFRCRGVDPAAPHLTGVLAGASS